MREVGLLAVTKMLSGVCIGGVPPQGGPWIRPIKQFGAILPGDIRFADGSWMAPFDVVEFNLLKPRPSPPHVEDWTCDFVRPRPRLVRRLDLEARRRLLEAALDPAVLGAWQSRSNSLALLRPDSMIARFSLDAYSSRYEARVEWPGCPRNVGCAVTDLRWRALGRRLLPESGGERTFSLEQLRGTIGCEAVYLAVGLSRSYEGQFWPIAVGVHCLPDYAVEIDPARL